MREMAEVALALGDAGVRLFLSRDILGVAVVAELCDRLGQELRVGPGMWDMAAQAVALVERFVIESDGRLRVRHILPVALSADFRHCSP